MVVGFQRKCPSHILKYLTVITKLIKVLCLSHMHLTWYANEQEWFLQCTVMTKQTWVNHATLKTKTHA